jgi:hypothetical protein
MLQRLTFPHLLLPLRLHRRELYRR